MPRPPVGFGTECPALVRLMIATRNFFRPHGGIGKITPGGRCLHCAGIVISGTDVPCRSSCQQCGQAAGQSDGAAGQQQLGTRFCDTSVYVERARTGLGMWMSRPVMAMDCGFRMPSQPSSTLDYAVPCFNGDGIPLPPGWYHVQNRQVSGSYRSTPRRFVTVRRQEYLGPELRKAAKVCCRIIS